MAGMGEDIRERTGVPPGPTQTSICLFCVNTWCLRLAKHSRPARPRPAGPQAPTARSTLPPRGSRTPSTDALDAAGNTTAAIGKGFAIGSAALVSLALFGAYVTRSKIDLMNSSILDPKVRVPGGGDCLLCDFLGALMRRTGRFLLLSCMACGARVLCGPTHDHAHIHACARAQTATRASFPPFQVFSGLLVGAMLPFWFSAMTMKSVGKAALAMVEEVRGTRPCAARAGRRDTKLCARAAYARRRRRLPPSKAPTPHAPLHPPA